MSVHRNGLRHVNGSALSVALIGCDGAGKTTVARALEADPGLSVRYLYMGVSKDSIDRALPTTRLAHAIKRRLRGPPAPPAGPREQAPARSAARPRRPARAARVRPAAGEPPAAHQAQRARRPAPGQPPGRGVVSPAAGRLLPPPGAHGNLRPPLPRRLPSRRHGRPCAHAQPPPARHDAVALLPAP